MSVTAWMAVSVFVAAYVLIATERVHRVTAALGGAVVMLAIGATDPEHAFFSEHAGIDWNVIFLLLGMMLIVAVLKRTGIFEYVAIRAAKRAKGRPYRLMVLLILSTAFLSAWLDNVTTVLLIAPVTIVVCQRLAVPVVPYLIAEVMACNIGGAATLIGDPPNIIIGSRAGLSLQRLPAAHDARRRDPGADIRPDEPVDVPLGVPLRPGAGEAGHGDERAGRHREPASPRHGRCGGRAGDDLFRPAHHPAHRALRGGDHRRTGAAGRLQAGRGRRGA